jgi:hypothetical protein
LRLDRQATDETTADCLTQSQLAFAVSSAAARLQSVDGENAVAPPAIHFEILDLPGNLLGLTSHHTIQIDINAAGYGWFVDPTPRDDSEFAPTKGAPELTARPDTFAAERADLLTVVMHELAHVLGQDHADGGLMDELLSLGVRRVWNGEPLSDDLEASGKMPAPPGLAATAVDDYFAAT